MSQRNQSPVLPTFTDASINFMIQKVEEELAQSGVKLQAALTEFKSTEEIYLSDKEKYEQALKIHEERKQWLESLLLAKNAEGEQKILHLIRPTSHTKKPRRGEDSGREDWITPAGEVLEAVKHFLSPEELFSRVLNANPQLKQKFLNGGTSLKQRAIMNYIRHAGMAYKRKIGTQILVECKGMIGLYAWNDHNKHEPRPEFLKGVLFQGTSAKRKQTEPSLN